jgi:hypothetical protein
MVTLFCRKCGKKFKRSTQEYRRDLKLYKSVFCSMSCSVSFGNITRFRDEFTPFRWYLKRSQDKIKTSNRFKITINDKCSLKQLRERQIKKAAKLMPVIKNNLTTKYLKRLWEKQNGLCPLTGWALHMPTSTQGKYEVGKERMKAASLDRINNSKGYVKGNVRYIAMIANFARNKFSDVDLINFCKAVTENQRKITCE